MSKELYDEICKNCELACVCYGRAIEACSVKEIIRLRNQIEWLWSNCRIKYYPNGIDPMKGDYPIQHYISNGINKDSRNAIESFYPKDKDDA
jgi:hypothetical protein